MSGIQNLLLGGSPVAAAAGDPDFEYVTLLLPGNGTNGAQNNTFLDSSTNAFSITRNGNTTQGTFSPFSQTGWSNYFDGSTDYLSTTSTQILPTGDFTIEAFIYFTGSFSTYPSIFAQGTAGNAGRTNFYLDTSGKLGFAIGTTVATSTGTVTANAWNYVAVTRSGSTVTFYINGSSSGTATNSGTPQNTSIRIGLDWNAGEEFTGYISNLRISDNVRTITATPTAPYSSDANTKLLTCQSNRFVDNSSNGYALTVNGTPSVQAFSPFNPTAAWSAATNGGSGYFDGTGDYLTVADNAAFDLGSGAFTLEAWIYTPDVTPSKAEWILSQWQSDTNNSWGYRIETDGTLNFYYSSDGSNASLVGTATPGLNANSWHHVAVVRNSNTVTIYVDGVSKASGTVTATFYNSTANVSIGNQAATGLGQTFTGYISSARVVKGTAVYTTGFTPPTAPLTAISGTSLLTNFTNAGIYDATAKNDLETVGDSQISNTTAKFGSTSIKFDGTGDWLLTRTSPNLDMGTGDLTIEGWFYLTTSPADYQMIVSDATNGNNYVCIRGGGTGGQIEVNVSGTSFRFNLNNSVSASTWFHLAVSRYNGTWYGFINGASLGSASGSGAFNLGNGGMYVGRFGGATAYAWPGYMQDLRITKGIARYTQNFTPPTAAFQLL